VKAAIFDLDDTLVTRQRGEEKVLEPVRELVETVDEQDNYCTIILTARAESVRDQTKNLLDRCGIDFDELYMRPDDDFALTDDRFKEGVLQKLEKEGYDIRFVVEDKGKVADMWASNGIDCLKMPERHAFRHKIVRKLRTVYSLLPALFQEIYLDFYRRRFS
jgi:arginyl-tRNA synthetase